MARVIGTPLREAMAKLRANRASVAFMMIGPAMDEVLASLQHLQAERRAGRSVWRACWGLSEDALGSRPALAPGVS